MPGLRDLSVTELVIDAAAGDSAAWDALVGRFAGTVWAVARGYRLSAADAADVSQTTWLRLVEHLDRIEQPDRIGGWLATTARRESLRVLRMSGRQVADCRRTRTGALLRSDPARSRHHPRRTQPHPQRPGRPASCSLSADAAPAGRRLAAQLSRAERGIGDAHRESGANQGPMPGTPPAARDTVRLVPRRSGILKD